MRKAKPFISFGLSFSRCALNGERNMEESECPFCADSVAKLFSERRTQIFRAIRAEIE
jgi:hypothetical protein